MHYNILYQKEEPAIQGKFLSIQPFISSIPPGGNPH